MNISRAVIVVVGADVDEVVGFAVLLVRATGAATVPGARRRDEHEDVTKRMTRRRTLLIRGRLPGSLATDRLQP
jgi:hypothetical protein